MRFRSHNVGSPESSTRDFRVSQVNEDTASALPTLDPPKQRSHIKTCFHTAAQLYQTTFLVRQSRNILGPIRETQVQKIHSSLVGAIDSALANKILERTVIGCKVALSNKNLVLDVRHLYKLLFFLVESKSGHRKKRSPLLGSSIFLHPVNQKPALCISSCGQGSLPVALLCIGIVPGNGCDSGDHGEVSIVRQDAGDDVNLPGAKKSDISPDSGKPGPYVTPKTPRDPHTPQTFISHPKSTLPVNQV
ncbi:hypothetical protein E5288_WYG017430 [Bos mutus]|uniref:Uncharacterized protein n=1 Tax=Bos mutus TaxID=72004 RepID=A0A6B0RJP6_9CETA|nr:hypothetical protein [Bos mutus]